MAYTTYLYLLLFLSITLTAYTLTPKRVKWTVLLLASYAFYFISSKWLLIYLLATTLSVYFSGIWLGKINNTFESAKKLLSKDDKKVYKDNITRQKKAVVLLMILFNFGLLFYFKYFNFFGENLNSLLPILHIPFRLPALNLLLPLGISFYTLQAASYVIDVYRGKCEADENLGRIALFLCFFPQIVEGPIGRYDQLANQLYEGHSFSYKNVTFGIQLIVWGLFKKIVIADRADMLVKSVFGDFANYSGITVIVAILLYTLQIYAEFSGCMDIVTGSAQLFSVHLSKNFERPFFSKSVNEFWRRWHITLGSWLRDYVFYSVSLSKPFRNLSKSAKAHLNAHFGKLLPVACALFLVWFGCGIWHGASWKYIAYGMYYYIIMLLGMVCEPLFTKFLSATHINRESKAYRMFQMFRTFVLVNIGMLIFRATTLRSSVKMLHSIFAGFSANVLMDGSLLKLGIDKYDAIILASGVILIFIVGLLQEKGFSLRESIAMKNIVFRWSIYFVGIFAVIILGAYGAGYVPVDFIYAQF